MPVVGISRWFGLLLKFLGIQHSFVRFLPRPNAFFILIPSQDDTARNNAVGRSPGQQPPRHFAVRRRAKPVAPTPSRRRQGGPIAYMSRPLRRLATPPRSQDRSAPRRAFTSRPSKVDITKHRVGTDRKRVVRRKQAATRIPRGSVNRDGRAGLRTRAHGCLGQNRRKTLWPDS